MLPYVDIWKRNRIMLIIFVVTGIFNARREVPWAGDLINEIEHVVDGGIAVIFVQYCLR